MKGQPCATLCAGNLSRRYSSRVFINLIDFKFTKYKPLYRITCLVKSSSRATTALDAAPSFAELLNHLSLRHGLPHSTANPCSQTGAATVAYQRDPQAIEMPSADKVQALLTWR